MGDSNALTNALIGAILTAVLSWVVPLAPIGGGAVAAYLQGADTAAGVRTGTLSGVIALVPLGVLGAAVVGLVGVVTLDPTGTAVSLAVVAAALFVSTLYVVGLSALGGYLGTYLFDEYGRTGRSIRPEERP
ncbi:DUF5518 domain-containing protein [Halalkalicoccus jeotgali]|uniref:DUF5518 domain-containing protein n=1 Tax=Halalkalicoccus jeotgali (strain DSM 18796 / CECT 7217 / JCM 14584 / KCTC 4019 / B3) TaxID=795797 RepID=D8J916_HALJB|nr:DUF5518 domain-containing protein [Halalkalicoccus jeotgali]ADJ16285.1 hypothetical protein HacjB3_14520 [Halalkalicoccus jeotgali B3]ELY37019.1 hypothetical protein C497_09758 [Halalkalicoccus jeotgali B3]